MTCDTRISNQAKEPQSKLWINEHTFSRIFVEISGNSMRPVRFSKNNPSGAVKMAAKQFERKMTDGEEDNNCL
jgi:hypothetical protein